MTTALVIAVVLLAAEVVRLRIAARPPRVRGAGRAWVVGDGLVLPLPDDPRWRRVVDLYGVSRAELGQISVPIGEDSERAKVMVGGVMVPGFQAWRYARVVRRLWQERTRAQRLERQRQAALAAIEEGDS